MEVCAVAGSMKAAAKERSYAGAGSRKEAEPETENPMPYEFPFSFGLGPAQEEGGGKKRRKKTYRLGMEYIDYVAENPLPPLYVPDPSLHVGISELQEKFIAKQKAEREERENIVKQLKEFGYADVEVEVPDYDEGPGSWHGVKAA